MKTKNAILVGLTTLLLLTQISHVHSAGFELVSATAAGGGVTHATGGGFSLAGTVGQRDAGLSSGDSFRLEGGFWHNVALVQLLGSPVLGIRLGGAGRAVLYWPVTVTGFQLEERDDVATGTWTAVGNVPFDTASEHTVIVNLGSQKKFYRLRKP